MTQTLPTVNHGSKSKFKAHYSEYTYQFYTVCHAFCYYNYTNSISLMINEIMRVNRKIHIIYSFYTWLIYNLSSNSDLFSFLLNKILFSFHFFYIASIYRILLTVRYLSAIQIDFKYSSHKTLCMSFHTKAIVIRLFGVSQKFSVK